MNGTHWTVARMTYLQLWRKKVPALLVASVFFGLVLPLYFIDAQPSSPKMFRYAQTAGLSASFSVLWFVALNLLGLERTQRSLPLVTTRPAPLMAYLGGRCLGVVLLYSQCFAVVSFILVLEHQCGRTEVTASCVAFWLFYFVKSSAQIMVAVVAGALFSQGVAFFLVGLFYLFVEWFPALFFGDRQWFLNGAAHVAFYLAPYSGPPRQLASLKLTEPLAGDTFKWMALSGLDHWLYAACLLLVAGIFFRERNEQLTAGK